jgi:hypothetical protein
VKVKKSFVAMFGLGLCVFCASYAFSKPQLVKHKMEVAGETRSYYIVPDYWVKKTWISMAPKKYGNS